MMTFPYEKPVEPSSENMDPNKLSDVIERFQRQQSSGAFPGGQMVVRRKGKVVLNVATGFARGFRSTEPIKPVKVQPQTPFPVYSSGKPLAAIAIGILEERGLLDVNAPIAEVFPEFAQHGKGNITTMDVLTHRAGILVPSLYTDYKNVANRESVLSRLVDAKPMYKRGTFAYMPTEFGAILCEIVHRLVRKTLSEFVTEEISLPLNLPALRYGLANRAHNTLAYTYWLGKDKVMVGGNNVAENFEEINNSSELFDSKNPAFSMVTDAASLAAFYEFLLNKGVTSTGEQLLSENTIRRYTTRSVSGWNKSLGTFIAVGRGFTVGTLTPSAFGWWNTGECFGHGGAFSSLAFGDYKTGIAVSIVTNGNRNIGDFIKRFIPLTDRLRKACL
jgi:CubicO group peptidase (beta-lactamase class C family)